MIPESDGWISLDPSLLHGELYGNSISVAAPLEIAMGTDFNMGVGFIPPVTCNVQPSSGQLRPCIFEINPPDNVPKVLVDHDPDIEVCPIQGKDLLAEIDPGLINGTVTVDDKSQTTRILVDSGINVWNRFPCIALLDSGSPQSFLTESAWRAMVSCGAADPSLMRTTPPRSWGGFGTQKPLLTSTHVRLSVLFLLKDTPSAMLSVWRYLVPDGTMETPCSLRKG